VTETPCILAKASRFQDHVKKNPPFFRRPAGRKKCWLCLFHVSGVAEAIGGQALRAALLCIVDARATLSHVNSALICPGRII